MATINVYDVGSEVSIVGTFKDKTNQPQDPSTVTLRVKDPTASTPTVYTFALGQVTKDSQGVYRKDFDTTAKPGKWLYRWESTGLYAAAADGAFFVKASPLA